MSCGASLYQALPKINQTFFFLSLCNDSVVHNTIMLPGRYRQAKSDVKLIRTNRLRQKNRFFAFLEKRSSFGGYPAQTGKPSQLTVCLQLDRLLKTLLTILGADNS